MTQIITNKHELFLATEDTEIAENRNGAINVTATAMATATA